MSDGLLGKDPERKLLSLFSGYARQRTALYAEARAAKRREAAGEGKLTDIQKSQLDVYDKIITNPHATAGEVKSAQTARNAVLGIELDVDFSEEIGQQKETAETLRANALEKATQELANLKQTGLFKKAQTSAASELAKARKAERLAGTDAGDDIKLTLDQIDKSIDNLRLILRKRKNIVTGGMEIDYDDPENIETLELINNYERERINMIKSLPGNQKLKAPKKKVAGFGS